MKNTETFKEVITKDLEQKTTPSLLQTKPANDCIDEAKKKDFNFLKFKFIGFKNELNQLKEITYNGLNSRNEEIASLKSEGNSNVSIAELLNISAGTVRNTLKKMNK